MAWLSYVPYLLFFLWLALTHYSLQSMTEKKFEDKAGIRTRKPVFYVSSYLYVVFSCFLAWLFQVEVVTGNPNGPAVPLWSHWLGIL